MPSVGGLGYVGELAGTAELLAEEFIERLFALDLDLVIHDSQTPWARVAGDYLGLPRIVAYPMFPVTIPYAKPSRADPWLPDPEPEEARARFEVHWLSIARRWGVEIESTHNVIHSAAETTITFTTQRILGAVQLPPGWHCVGPLMTPPPPTALPADRPLVYACFGTAYNTRPELFNAVVAGLADQPVDVLISTGNGMVTTADLDPMPPNVTLRSFVPAREILARASVHITHGGCSSVHESLLAGVPMVCMPQAYDQFPLARSVELLGAGLIAEEEPIEIREAVRLLLHSEKASARARELSEHLAHYDGERRVTEVIERVLLENAVLPTSLTADDQRAPGQRGAV
jgi:MGT family glycosyltransferase